MQLDGLKPTSGANPAERLKGKPKAEPGSGSAGAKSFGDAFAKAKAAGQAAPSLPSAPAPGQTPPPADHDIDTIRFRLQTGYYDNPKIDDALSDKLSGYFDDFA